MSGGVVGVIANDSARYSLFTACIWRLEMPDGWEKEPVIGGDWCGARNTLCRMMLDAVVDPNGITHPSREAAFESGYKGDGDDLAPRNYSHLWFMDDDHAFPPQMLTKLLAHDKAIVTPICLTRVYPFSPVQYTEKLDGKVRYLPIPLSQSDTDGLVEIQAGGCAGMLIRRDVIEAIEPPWFEYGDRSEDIVFCEKAKAAGFTLWADLSVRLGHITTAVVWPAIDNGKWVTGLNIGDLALQVETLAPPRDWTWDLRYEAHGPNGPPVVSVERPANKPVDWQPGPLAIPQGVMQWWVDENNGDGPHPVGDPFTYELKEAK